MAATRKQKMVRLLKEELSRIIREEMNDPRLGLLSITDVELTPDMNIANIYFSVYGTEEEQQVTMNVLSGAARFLRGELSRQIELRHTPELHFHLDKTIERAAHVFALLKEVAVEPVKEEQPTEESAKEEHDDQS